MTYQRWAWCDTDDEDKEHTVEETAMVQRLADEARSLYDSIPEPVVRGEEDDYRGPEFDDVEEAEAYYKREQDRIKSAWGQIEAIEALMGVRGARFCRPYEHWNEHEQLMEYLENE